MKKLFTLFALTLVAAISVNASAQSLVGKWNAEAGGSQYAMMQALGGEIEKVDNAWTFSNNNAYTTHSYIKGSFEIAGVVMHMEMEVSESGSWKLSGDDLTITSNDLDVIKLNITFSDPSLNSFSEMIKSSLLESFNSAIGLNVVYDIEFKDNNTVELEYDNEVMPLSFTLTRTR
jgi:hypothetical protein